MDPTTNMCEAELLLAALEPYPIIGASAQWCTQLGVKEPELKGCGFKVFDADFRGLTQSKVAEYGGTDNFSDEFTAAMTTALAQRRTVYIGATLELDAARAAVANCPPTRKVALCIAPVFEADNASDPSALPAPSVLRVVLKEQDIASTKEALSALSSGQAHVLSHISKPYRIAQVSHTWKDVFGLEESGCVGRSLKMIEGPLTQQSTLLSLYEAVSSGISSKWQLTTYHADGRPFINHLRVVPVKGDLGGMNAGGVVQARSNTTAPTAAPSGVTHCLWYMDAHEAVTDADAMSEKFYTQAAKVLATITAPHKILEVNDKWCQTWSVERQQVLGKSLDTLQPLTSPARLVREAWASGASMKTKSNEVLAFRPDDTPFIKRLKVHPVLGRTTGQLIACVGVVHQSMSDNLSRVVEDCAEAGLVVTASYPHTIVYANERWIMTMIPDYMRAQDNGTKTQHYAGKPLSGIALVAAEASSSLDTDDLMKMSSGGDAARILVAQQDAMRGCGAWIDAAVAPVYDVADGNCITHLVVSLDLSLAPKKVLELPKVQKSHLLQRSCEDPDSRRSTFALDCSDDEDEAINETHSRDTPVLKVLSRTCEQTPQPLPNLLTRTCEESASGECSEDEEDEDNEVYMDSEEEQVLIGDKLPKDELLLALNALLLQPKQLPDDGHVKQAVNPAMSTSISSSHRLCVPEREQAETVAGLKQRTKMLSDTELFEAIRDHAPQGKQEHYYTIEYDCSSDADDESTVSDTTDEGCEEQEGDEMGESLQGNMFRDMYGNSWSNSEVVTSIRVHVTQGQAIAPIYDEYLNVLRGKGFVESWCWPNDDTLSLQLPFGRVEKATNRSSWCQQHAPDLSCGEAWWTRLRYLVAAIQLNARGEQAETSIAGSKTKQHHDVETIMMPRGSVSRQEREGGLVCLRNMKVVQSWAWDNDDAVAVVVRPHALSLACQHSDFCNMWAPANKGQGETWGVSWLRMVWLMAQQPAFVASVDAEEMLLDLQTCLCSLHLHGLLPYE